MRQVMNVNQTVSAEIRGQITDLLYLEARLLDHGNYNEWLELMTDDLTYKMPARITNEGKQNKSNIDYKSRYFEETKNSLIIRVRRLDTNSAWAEFAGSRQRHFVSNILIEPTDNPDEFQVSSYFLFKRSRGSDPKSEEFFGERVDLLRKENGLWKIASRIIYPDHSVIVHMNLNIFL